MPTSIFKYLEQAAEYLIHLVVMYTETCMYFLPSFCIWNQIHALAHEISVHTLSIGCIIVLTTGFAAMAISTK